MDVCMEGGCAEDSKRKRRIMRRSLCMFEAVQGNSGEGRGGRKGGGEWYGRREGGRQWGRQEMYVYFFNASRTFYRLLKKKNPLSHPQNFYFEHSIFKYYVCLLIVLLYSQGRADVHIRGLPR